MSYVEGVIGLISDIDAQKMCVKVKIMEQNDFTTGWLPLLVIPGMYYVPKSQDQVFAFMDEEFEMGVVLGGVFNTPVPFTDPDVLGLKFPGIEIQINKQSGQIDIISSGNASIKATEVDIQGNLKLTGNFDMTGKASITGDTSTTGKIDAVGVIKSATDVRTLQASLNTHMHATTPTGPPTPPTPVPQP